jgi:hypothetical protein
MKCNQAQGIEMKSLFHRHGKLLATGAMLAALALPTSARAIDLQPYEPARQETREFWSQLYDPNRLEVRLGAFTHGVGSVESGTVDINLEVAAPRLPIWQNDVLGLLVPRPHVGGWINLSGKTSAAYAGLLWSFPLLNRFFGEVYLDAAVHNGQLDTPLPGRAELGCRVLFHVGGSVGYMVTPNWNAMVTFEHLSNGNSTLGTGCDKNQGVNNYGVRIGRAF